MSQPHREALLRQCVVGIQELRAGRACWVEAGRTCGNWPDCHAGCPLAQARLLVDVQPQADGELPPTDRSAAIGDEAEAGEAAYVPHDAGLDAPLVIVGPGGSAARRILPMDLDGDEPL